MNFFESQDVAQRSTKLLLILFVLAVLSIIALANLTVYLVVKFQTLGALQFDLSMLLAISGGVLLLILLGSAYRIYSLKTGGEAIAASLGGRLVLSGGGNEFERRLINVVEEMAIASGLPVPPVYLLDEDGINAFAAGYGAGDAVIGVTKGAILNLNREQLQGVIAHEFSHILNGDMRLNIRLVGVLHGILMLSVVGRVLLESRPGLARKSSSSFPVMFFGLSLFLIGYSGKFFGDLIKAGVSRQREFLADASAVQFTRNPDGISGALKRIGGHVAASNVHHSGAEEFSHLYFSNGFARAFISMLATHPPLEERIKRIDPGWSGEFQFHPPVTEMSVTEVPVNKKPMTSDEFAGVSNLTGAMNPDTVIASVGNPQIEQLAVARDLIGQIPETLRQAVREPFSVRAVVYLVFLHSEVERRAVQLELLKQDADIFVRARLAELIDVELEIPASIRLPLLELALPALRQLSDSEYQRLSKNLVALQKAGQPLSLSDWALGYYLNHHLKEAFGKQRASRAHRESQHVKKEIGYLLSVLAYSDKAASSEAVFAAGEQLLPFPVQLEPRSAISVSRLENAVQRLATVKPLQKPRILKAFVAVISADQNVQVVEAELLRCFADAIDCPMPPIAIT